MQKIACTDELITTGHRQCHIWCMHYLSVPFILINYLSGCALLKMKQKLGGGGGGGGGG